jgi:hypothetical protein
MLLNEFLKANKKVERLETTIARQQEQIEALTAGRKKVTARIKMSQQTAQIAGNNLQVCAHDSRLFSKKANLIVTNCLPSLDSNAAHWFRRGRGFTANSYEASNFLFITNRRSLVDRTSFSKRADQRHPEKQ